MNPHPLLVIAGRFWNMATSVTYIIIMQFAKKIQKIVVSEYIKVVSSFAFRFRNYDPEDFLTNRKYFQVV